MKMYKFIINDKEKMTKHLRKLSEHGCNVCVKSILDSGYFNTYLMDDHKPEDFANMIGSNKWEEVA